MDKNFFKILDQYIYNDYLIYLNDVTSKNNAFLTSPYYYFKKDFLKNISNNNKINRKDFILLLKKHDERYLFLIDKEWFIKNPEFLNEGELENIKKILIEDNNNFYAFSAYITYYYNKWDLDIDYYYNKWLEIDNNNPHILVKYSRYHASALYKKYKDKKYLVLWKNNIILAIDQFENKRDIPTFFYSWLWYIEHELWNYEKAIELYNLTITLNTNLGVNVPEPYVWKSFSLNKIWKYNESLKMTSDILLDNILNSENDKRDFRLYKVHADNFYNLWIIDDFYINLKNTINKYLEISSFHINNVVIIDLKNLNFVLSSIIQNNRLKSFLEYNKKNIKSNVDKVIFILAFFYKEYLLWEKVLFNDSRWIELLCYNYLKLVYEWKYN